MPFRSRPLLLALLAAAPAPARPQGLGFVAPPGRRHFIVMADRSVSMASEMLRNVPPGSKRQSLGKAERALADWLFGSRRKPGRYRRGDLLTVVHFGIDTRLPANQAYLRLAYAQLGDDYAHLAAPRSARMTRQGFLRAVRPAVRTRLNILAWALPLCLERAAVGPALPVQETYAIFLNDAQLNEGGLIMERTAMALHLKPAVFGRLERAEAREDRYVRLTDDEGRAGASLVRRFGPPQDPVVLTVFRAASRPAMEVARQTASRGGIEDVSLGWTRAGSAWRLSAEVQTPRALRGARAVLRVAQGGKAVASREFTLAGRQSVGLAGLSGPSGARCTVRLTVLRTVDNPVLGRQRIGVPFDALALLPEAPDSARRRAWQIAILAVAGTLLVGAAIWAYRQRFHGRHLKLELADYVPRFPLRPLAHSQVLTLRLRDRAYRGDFAMGLALPPRLVRRLFYRRAVLRWGDWLERPDHPGTEARLTDLPRFVRLVWSKAPPSFVAVRVSLTRPPGDELKITLEYTAPFDPAPSALPRHA